VAFEACMASLILVRNVVGELHPKRTLAASRGFLAAARLSCWTKRHVNLFVNSNNNNKTEHVKMGLFISEDAGSRLRSIAEWRKLIVPINKRGKAE